MWLLTVIRVLALSCFVAGCGGSSSGAHANGSQPIGNSAKQPLAGMLPVVDGGDVLATVWTDRGEPSGPEAFRRQVPVLVIVDARGAGDIPTTRAEEAIRSVRKMLREKKGKTARVA
jgi:hypothetical protein